MNSQLHAQQRTRIEQVYHEAVDLAGVATQIAQAARETLDRGGTLDIQKQMNFLTSTYARMTKDWGVIEHLQQIGKIVLRPMLGRRPG